MLMTILNPNPKSYLCFYFVLVSDKVLHPVINQKVFLFTKNIQFNVQLQQQIVSDKCNYTIYWIFDKNRLITHEHTILDWNETEN